MGLKQEVKALDVTRKEVEKRLGSLIHAMAKASSISLDVPAHKAYVIIIAAIGTLWEYGDIVLRKKEVRTDEHEGI